MLNKMSSDEESMHAVNYSMSLSDEEYIPREAEPIDLEISVKQGVKRRRNSGWTVEEKLSIIDRVRGGEKQTSVARELSIPESTLRGWLKNEETLRTFLEEMEGAAKRKRNSAHKPQDPVLDATLFSWFSEQVANGVPLNGPLIQAQARKLNRLINGRNSPLVCSSGWFMRWKNRHGIRFLDGDCLGTPSHIVIGRPIAEPSHNILEASKLISASEKTAEYFVKKVLTKNGELTAEDVAGDLAAQYKLPTLLMVTGRGRLAHKVLDNIKKMFMQEDGDFLSFAEKSGDEQKSDSADFQRYWLYMNGWVAMAAHRLGRFDISVPARRYLEKFYNAKLNGYSVGPKDLASDGLTYNVDVFMSSHLGLLALYFGDIERATDVGELIGQFVAQQPDLDKHFLVRMQGDSGELLRDIPEGQENFYRISSKEPQQLFFLLGYPVLFLYHLSQATEQDRFIQMAEAILDFLLRCDGSIFSFFLSHNVAFGAGLVAQHTGKTKYRELCAKIVSHLLTLQDGDGSFAKALPTLVRLDQSAEIAIWLRELSSHLTTLV